MTADEALEIANKFNGRDRMPEIMDVIKNAASQGLERQMYPFDNVKEFLVSKDVAALKKLGYRIVVRRGHFINDFGILFQKMVWKEWLTPSVWISWDNYVFGEGYEEL